MTNLKRSPETSSPPGFKPTPLSISSVPAPSNWNYEATVAEVESIIARIEAGDLDLADVFDQFSTAVEHLRQCETFLLERQQQMGLLIQTLVDEPEDF
ncbi:MAG: exodeoxyribonuclease VII small subunit [Leptolyngbyaceae bacterium]|nr:exodeoxyribonuclease VII small subunit [Leptolyngbyaceae bacterium]